MSMSDVADYYFHSLGRLVVNGRKRENISSGVPSRKKLLAKIFTFRVTRSSHRLLSGFSNQ
jgi:hypothetical protein